MRPSCAGLYFAGDFIFGTEEIATRYGIAVSLSNENPKADGTDSTCAYTNDHNSVLIANILSGSAEDATNAKRNIYVRAYVLLSDGTYIYSDTIVFNLKAVVEAIDAKSFDTLGNTAKTSLAGLYQTYTTVMEKWQIPKIKQYGVI